MPLSAKTLFLYNNLYYYVNSDGNSVTLTNMYNPSPTYPDLNGDKSIDGNDVSILLEMALSGD